MAREFLDQVNDLLSSFMTLVFEEADRRNLEAAQEGARTGGPSEYAARRALLLEHDFRGLMESAILNNGALYDAYVRTLQSYPDDAPAPDTSTWGAWGRHVDAYQRSHSVNFARGVLSVVYQWIRASTSRPDHVGGAYIVVRQPLHCSLMLFKCLQHVVYTVIFKNPWLYVPSCQTPYERDQLLRDLENATKTALVLAHVQIPDPGHTDTVVEELKGVFEDGDLQPAPFVGKSAPRLRDAILDEDAPPTDHDSGSAPPLDDADTSRFVSDDESEQDSLDSASGSDSGGFGDINADMTHLSECVRSDPRLDLGDGRLNIDSPPPMRGEDPHIL
jgi:hypothetical protein